MDYMLERWKKAVVHLEGAASSVPLPERIALWQKLPEKLEKGEITPEGLAEAMQIGSRDIRCRGTAIFLQHESKRYLLTARHVVHDRVEAQRLVEAAEERAEEQVSRGASRESAEAIVQQARHDAANLIFEVIFRVPLLDELQYSGVSWIPDAFLMNASAGLPEQYPYTFSSAELDVAVIALDQGFGFEEFANDLQVKGHEPIAVSDTGDRPSSEGADVFSVGFPGSTATIDERDQPSAQAHWSSSGISLPVFAFGKVAAAHQRLDYFWCDMSIYPGNSGGPIVEDNKLVGIVSQQARVEGTRIPFGRVVNAEQIKTLLYEQIAKGQV